MAAVVVACLTPTLLLPAGCRSPVPAARGGAARMLRNIDRCELIVFSRDAALQASGAVREGAARLIGEAQEQGTLIALLEPADRLVDAESPIHELLGGAPCWRLHDSEPQVAEVTELRKALRVESPDGFGGSDGFGRAPGAAYGRAPEPPRCVVLVTSLQETEGSAGRKRRLHCLRMAPHVPAWCLLGL